MKFLIPVLVFGCASPKPVSTAEPTPHLLGRLLCDACTKQETTEECIAHAAFILEHCHNSPAACMHFACVKLREGETDDFVPTCAVHWTSR